MLKRYVIFLIGLFINSFGVSFITKASLGTSPISSIPYVLSLAFKPTLGNFTILFSLILIIMQMIILGKKFQMIQLIQIPVSIIFGYFIDYSMLLLSSFQPELYAMKGLSLLIGCFILGFGVYIEVLADVVMLPGEAFVKAITTRFGTDFGTTKVCFDASMTIMAGIMSLLVFQQLRGVREGTIIAALIVGLIAKQFGKTLAPLTLFLFPDTEGENSRAEATYENHYIITVSREFGSNGSRIGEMIAGELGIAYFDHEIIQKAAEKSGYSKEFIESNEEKLTNGLLYDLYLQNFAYVKGEESKREALFHAEQEVIRDFASKSSAVIVGRLANYALKDYKNVYHIFLRADTDYKIRTVQEREHIGFEEAAHKIEKINIERSNHCKFFTGQEWGQAENYDLILNVSKYSMEDVVQKLVAVLPQS
ncbi:cytidylate kinase family protein [Aminipila butyrica]|uniref:Cytidylate kinase family protein n=1 Tax=Aminipila butyrica TaxID=433296 RepID=A0A858BX82_9FIRM|nr:cytidylate kinase family protein [Aminipila butyrica]